MSNNDKIEYYKKYLTTYYNGKFFKNQGIEEIFAMMKSENAGNWLDCCSAVCTLFWSMAFKHISSISCLDICNEAHIVHQEFIKSSTIPECYKQAAELLNLYIENIPQNRKIFKDFFIADIIQNGYQNITSKYNTITSMGILDYTKNEEEFIKCIHDFADISEKSCNIYGANWLRSNRYTNFIGDYNIDEDKISNSHITNDLLKRAAKDYFEIKHLQTIHIKNDKNFSDVVIWHLQK